MKQIRGEITSVTGGVVNGWVALPASSAKNLQLIAVLDGGPGGLVSLGPFKSGRAAFSLVLPSYRIYEQVDFLDARTGQSVLSSAYDLAGIHRLTVTRLELLGAVVRGAFVVAGALDPVLLVQIACGSDVLGSCTATRVAARDGLAGELGRYDFTWPLTTLCPLDRRYSIHLNIAGLNLAQGPSLTISAQAVGLVGYVDSAEADMISGWVVDLEKPSRRLSVDLLHDGNHIATCMSDQPRVDLPAHGLGDGFSAFSFSVPEVRVGEPPTRYAVRLAGTATHLINSPLELTATGRLVGFFDDVSAGFVGGWLCNLDDPETPVEVEVVCEGQVIACGLANIARQDVVRAGMPTSACGFRINLGAALLRANIGREISVRARGTRRYLDGSPKTLVENPNIGRFLERGKRCNDAAHERLKRTLNHRTAGQPISIIMPVHNTQQDWLIEALESVRTQWCDHFELICVNDFSTDPNIGKILETYARHDRRFRVLTTTENVGIARATNFGLRAARHEYVTFMDHDDYLEPDAIYCLIRAIIDTDADFIYSDEALTHEDINSILEVRARPAFSYDYYLSHPYFVHMLCVRTDLARKIAGWDENLVISADVDFVLRIIEVADTVAHLPAVLYRWRTHSSSAGHSKQALVMEATKSAIGRHLQRCGIVAEVSDGVFFNQFRIDYPADDGEILIIIPTRNKVDLLKTCIESIEKTALGVGYRIVVIDHESSEPATRRYLQKISSKHVVMPYKGRFNYARMNNVAARKYGRNAKYILFCNNDVEAEEPGWLDRLRSLANRQEVGAVGPMLLYGDRRVQHAGVIIGFNNAAEHVGKFAEAYIDGGQRRNLGYNCTFSSLRDFSAVTAACMLLRRAVFDQVGGFDESFAIGFNDTDLCLRIREAGYKVLYDGNTLLLHHESATRAETKQVFHPGDDGRLRRRWASYFTGGDPFYSPMLDLRANDHTIRDDQACRRVAAPRVTQLGLTHRAKPAANPGAGVSRPEREFAAVRPKQSRINASTGG